jgi:16S rRNA processing protein RimM
MYLIGYVLKPQGIKGEIKVDPVSSDPRRYKQLDKIYIDFEENKQIYIVERTRIADRFVFLKLRGIESRDDAENLRGREILIREEDLIQPAENEFFIHDLIGCQVVTSEGQIIGILRNVMQLGSNDVYAVENNSGEEILIPAIKDVVKRVDVANKRITIHLLEGLVD